MSVVSAAKLVLVRHGQGSLGTDDYDRLSPLGERQASLTAARLAPLRQRSHSLWSGALRRHRQTLAHMAAESEATISADLDEYRVDHLIESAMAQAQTLALEVPGDEAFANPEAYLQTFLDWFPSVLEHWQQARLVCQQNGQWQAFHQRVTRPLSAWQSQLRMGQDAVVVTSAGVISTVIAEATGQSLDYQRALNVGLYNASVSELGLGHDGQWQLLTVNCVDHLDNELRTLA